MVLDWSNFHFSILLLLLLLFFLLLQEKKKRKTKITFKKVNNLIESKNCKQIMNGVKKICKADDEVNTHICIVVYYTYQKAWASFFLLCFQNWRKTKILHHTYSISQSHGWIFWFWLIHCEWWENVQHFWTIIVIFPNKNNNNK